MDMCWYVRRCLVSSMHRYVVSVLSYMVSRIIGKLSCFGSKLSSLSNLVRSKSGEVVWSEEYVSKLV